MARQLTEAEQGFVNNVLQALDEFPDHVPALFAEALRQRRVRCLLVSTRHGRSPSVQVTLTMDDVTAEAVRQVVVPVLRKAGVAEDAIPMMAGIAGSAVASWLAKQRAKREEAQRAEWSSIPDGPPKWTPGRRR